MKTVFPIVLNILMFFAFVAIMPNVQAQHGPVGILLAGFGFALIMVFLTNILKFFKFPDNFWGKLLIGTLLSLVYFAILQFVIGGLIKFGSSYIGGSDFIIFTLPKLVTLADPVIVLIFSAVALVVCSIMLEKLSEE